MNTMPLPRKPSLTAMDLNILWLYSQGTSIKNIGDEISLSPNYIYFRLRQMRHQFYARTNTELVTQAIAQGVISADGFPQIKWAEGIAQETAMNEAIQWINEHQSSNVSNSAQSKAALVAHNVEYSAVVPYA